MKDGQGMALLGEPTRQSQGKTGQVMSSVQSFMLYLVSS